MCPKGHNTNESTRHQAWLSLGFEETTSKRWYLNLEFLDRQCRKGRFQAEGTAWIRQETWQYWERSVSGMVACESLHMVQQQKTKTVRKLRGQRVSDTKPGQLDLVPSISSSQMAAPEEARMFLKSSWGSTVIDSKPQSCFLFFLIFVVYHEGIFHLHSPQILASLTNWTRPTTLSADAAIGPPGSPSHVFLIYN